MKKIKIFFAYLMAFCFGLNAFAFDAAPLFVPTNGVKSYVETDYAIASKFGEYFRTPNKKYQHTFNVAGQEIENSELSIDGRALDKIVYEYDKNGRVAVQSGYDDSDTLVWKVVSSYNASGLKTEEAEYDGKNNLSSKLIYKYSGKNCVDETFYNGDGTLIWKNIFVYDERNVNTEAYSYYANGSLEAKKVFKYNELNKIQEITYYDYDEVSVTKRELYRYDAKNVLTEIATYSADNTLYLRQFFKYDSHGNVNKITTYRIAKKFGTTVNELVGMSDFVYQY